MAGGVVTVVTHGASGGQYKWRATYRLLGLRLVRLCIIIKATGTFLITIILIITFLIKIKLSKITQK